MIRTFSASVTREGAWYVAQALEVDVASQGLSEDEALGNLRGGAGAVLSASDGESAAENQAGRGGCRLGRADAGARRFLDSRFRGNDGVESGNDGAQIAGMTGRESARMKSNTARAAYIS